MMTTMLIAISAIGQAPKKYNSSEIQQKLQKLNVLGTVLYVAAHPDDENTRLIAYFANEEKMRTAYLSATRGDGGQNLIGPEIREKLGIIRTQELLAARRTDGGQQFFSRANDFGYSKHPDETFNIWDKEEVLKDFVWVIRKFRPDIMVTRFNETPGVTHGHHTGSAILAREAFKLAGRSDIYPEQLKYVRPWQPKKIFWNTSPFFFRRSGQEFDTTGVKTVDAGAYNAPLGLSYPEIAATSRSMHKSQGFGSTGRRGRSIEYLKQWEGENKGDIWDGIDTGWSRVADSKTIQLSIEKAINEFDAVKPYLITPYLLDALKGLESLKDPFWKDIKTEEIKEVLKGCLGLYFEAKGEDFAFVPGDSINITYELINRSPIKVTVNNIYLNEIRGTGTRLTQKLENNRPFTNEQVLLVPKNFKLTNPYWLNDKGSLGMYTVKDQNQRGKPQNDPAISATYELTVEGMPISFSSPVIYKRTDPVDGEVYRPLEITPPVFTNLDTEVLLFSSNDQKEVTVTVTSGQNNVKGRVKLGAPSSWKISPAYYDFDLKSKGEQATYQFKITPPTRQSKDVLTVSAVLNGVEYDNGLSRIVYDHIPVQAIYTPSTASLVKVNIKKKGSLVGYIMGAGDDIPNNLRQVGYQVDLLSEGDISVDALKRYDAVILGVRALNTVGWLKFKMPILHKYTEEGGNLILQYNTSFRLVTNEFSPFPLKLSRDRVTVEEAPVRILAPDHPVMNSPHKITQKDFDGWVQERGLYFPNEWDEKFTPILSSNDPGEPERNGGLLVAKYGKGYYIYSGYSWFRELPAGVPGAYRIFTNLISLGK